MTTRLFVLQFATWHMQTRVCVFRFHNIQRVVKYVYDEYQKNQHDNTRVCFFLSELAKGAAIFGLGTM